MVSKDKLRIISKEKRKFIKDKKIKENIITKKLLSNEKIINSNNILVYISMSDEVSTKNFIEELLKLKKNIYAPRVLEKQIKFYKINSLEEFELSSLGINEPISNIEYVDNNNSVCIVPGLMFDKYNNRLGYGGGYYDKYLSEHNIYKIGICFSDFLVNNINVDDYDIKMDEVITEV